MEEFKYAFTFYWYDPHNESHEETNVFANSLAEAKKFFKEEYGKLSWVENISKNKYDKSFGGVF